MDMDMDLFFILFFLFVLSPNIYYSLRSLLLFLLITSVTLV